MSDYDTTRTLREFNGAQARAIGAIERAFAQAERAGLAVCGMDNDLLVYRADDLDAIERECGSLYDAQRTLMDAGFNLTIETGGVYRDSGGW